MWRFEPDEGNKPNNKFKGLSDRRRGAEARDTDEGELYFRLRSRTSEYGYLTMLVRAVHNYGKRLKTLKCLPAHEFIVKPWASESED